MKRRAVFFDLYETLVSHFDPGWKPPDETHAQRLGLDEDTYARLWKTYDRQWQAGETTSYADTLAQLCLAAGHVPDEHALSSLVDDYRRMTNAVFETIEPEVIRMLERLKQRGFTLGVITNASDLDAAPWATCSLGEYFDDFVASHNVRLLKSDTRIFHLACERLGVSPDESVFVGDGGGNELASARAAGMQVY